MYNTALASEIIEEFVGWQMEELNQLTVVGTSVRKKLEDIAKRRRERVIVERIVTKRVLAKRALAKRMNERVADFF